MLLEQRLARSSGSYLNPIRPLLVLLLSGSFPRRHGHRRVRLRVLDNSSHCLRPVLPRATPRTSEPSCGLLTRGMPHVLWRATPAWWVRCQESRPSSLNTIQRPAHCLRVSGDQRSLSKLVKHSSGCACLHAMLHSNQVPCPTEILPSAHRPLDLSQWSRVFRSPFNAGCSFHRSTCDRTGASSSVRPCGSHYSEQGEAMVVTTCSWAGRLPVGHSSTSS